MTAPIGEQLPNAHPTGTDTVKAAMNAIYNWNYEPEIDQLRDPSRFSWTFNATFQVDELISSFDHPITTSMFFSA